MQISRQKALLLFRVRIQTGTLNYLLHHNDSPVEFWGPIMLIYQIIYNIKEGKSKITEEAKSF